ncbi:4-hydroxy-tetrahydrodipicolinate synthase [Basilea psittacipulmonis]|uniref:4-hydroxy-tetrahydrodipicolinate synthase n=1 Tax=Basilea psittacipulmonis DSM 24701 TaxID=1072685 RepID=A0A077DE43_9BURK|nr:4-hydroxy-tetrahydrodipicolinate synthase [Basilea psittacipulmonis]AIL32939.1 dihydrodipicolinate synthase [Basilea psittacipulmonis DSM 24701]
MSNEVYTPVIKGSIPALVTPMDNAGNIDYEAYKKLIDWHIEQGSDGLVVVGTSGESPTIDFDEHEKLIALAVEYVDGRVPVIAGTGANATKEAVRLHKHAAKAGATAGLSVVPYYNKPTQAGLYEHFKTIAESSDLPVILYNVPGRTVVSLTNETILKLAELPNVLGIKDATGDLAKGAELLAYKSDEFEVYSGDDPTAAALILLGATANISVTANVAPALMHALCMAAYEGDVATVRTLNARLCDLNKALFVEANPIPVKWAVAELGLTQLGYRLPLVGMREENKNVVRAAMRVAGIL